LCRQHNSENYKDQDSANVNDELGRANEVRADEEIDPCRAAQGEEKPGRCPDNILRNYDGDSTQRREPANRPEEKCLLIHY
jgi:hypothetical protein